MAESSEQYIGVGATVVFRRGFLSSGRRRKIASFFGQLRKQMYVEDVDPIPKDLQRRMKILYKHDSSVWVRVRDLDGGTHRFPDGILKRMR